ncbi:hypothetical protein ACFL59_13600 [Planctomycetota bacterium]
MVPPSVASALKQRWMKFFKTVRRPASCPDCGHQRVWWDGSRRRSATVLAGEAVAHIDGIPCRRARCAGCSYRWTLRPPGMPARRHFHLDVVARAISRYLFGSRATQEAVAEEHGCSRRTLRRWLDWVAGLAEPAELACRIFEAAEEPVQSPLHAVVALARKARTAVRRAVLERAAQILSLLEAQAMALGLEPPGLRSVLEGASGRHGFTSTYAEPAIPALARGAAAVGRRLFSM